MVKNMALRGMLTQNIDKKESSEIPDFDYERTELVWEPFDSENDVICPQCGRMLHENSRFCNHCGAPLFSSGEKYYDERLDPSYSNTTACIPFASEPLSASIPETHNRTGVNDLGALRSRYSCALGILIGNIIFIAVGSAIIIWGVYMQQNDYVRLAAFFGYNPYEGLIPLGVIIVIACLIDLFIRKENYLEIYEYGIRGKGSVGWLGYRLMPFQFRFDEIINVENKVFALVPGICITAGSGDIREIHTFIRQANNAVEEINSIRESL